MEMLKHGPGRSTHSARHLKDTSHALDDPVAGAIQVSRKEEQSRPGRTVIADAQAVVAFRVGKGWAREDLARKAHRSLKSIDRIEAGQPVFPRTLEGVAAALNVPLEKLIVSADRAHNSGHAASCAHAVDLDSLVYGRRNDALAVEVRIVVPSDSKVPPHPTSIISGLRDAAGLKHPIRIVSSDICAPSIAPSGALIITAVMIRSDARVVFTKLVAGQLDSLDVRLFTRTNGGFFYLSTRAWNARSGY